MSPATLMEGVEHRPRNGYILVYPASVLIAMHTIEVEGLFPPLLLSTNFYCNTTGVDRVMWDGYTRAGTHI